MFSKPIDSSIREHFNIIYNNALSKASQIYKELNFKIIQKDHFNQLVILTNEENRIEDLIKHNEHPYYAQNNGEDWWLTQFANRTYLLNIDESGDLEEGIFLAKYRLLLREGIKRLDDGIPKYSYQMFLKGISCPYFVTFDSHYTTDEKNYNLITDWQAAHVKQIVSYEYLMFISQIQSYCKSLEDPLEYIVSQKEKAEFLLDKAELDAKAIKSDLTELSFLSNFNINDIDDSSIVESLKMYRLNDLNLKVISIETVKKPLSLIKKRHKGVISNESTIFYTIDKVADWLGRIIDGLPLNQVIKEPKWTNIISATKYKAAKEVKALTKQIEQKAYDESLTKSERKTFLIEQLEAYRYKFNNFSHKDYFYILRKGSEQLLKSSVIINAFFGNDIDKVLKPLEEAIIIQEMCWTIVQINTDVFNTHRMEYPDKDRSHAAVHSLLNSMVLDKDLYNEMIKSLDDFMVHYHNYQLPVELLFQNQKENMHHIFHRGIKRLQSVLDEAEPSNKILYLQSRLKELKQRELQFKQFSEERLDDYDDRYSMFLKDVLSIEAEFINETKNLGVLLPLKLGARRIQLPTVETFESLLTEEKQLLVLRLLEDLSLTKNGVSIISSRKKGSLRGIVEALSEFHILPAKSIDILCKIIADKIQLELKSKLDFSAISNDYKSKALKYLKELHKIQ